MEYTRDTVIIVATPSLEASILALEGPLDHYTHSVGEISQ